MTTLLYIHGFLSSPASTKVVCLKKAAAERGDLTIIAPDLNCPPLEADRRIEALFEQYDLTGAVVIGSSLGGFYAARTAARHGLRSILINPCLSPWERVPEWVGRRQVYGTDRELDVLPSFADDFLALAQAQAPQPDTGGRTLAVLSTCDEVLDPVKTREACRGAREMILPGEDHRVSGFEKILPALLAFATSDAQ